VLDTESHTSRHKPFERREVIDERVRQPAESRGVVCADTPEKESRWNLLEISETAAVPVPRLERDACSWLQGFAPDPADERSPSAARDNQAERRRQAAHDFLRCRSSRVSCQHVEIKLDVRNSGPRGVVGADYAHRSLQRGVYNPFEAGSASEEWPHTLAVGG
jgi:hypothetical protein